MFKIKKKIYFLTSIFLSLISLAVYGENHDKWIVVTTIQYPTEALKKFASLSDWRLVVVGDKKTPQDWHLENCIYLSADDQEMLPYSIAKLLPWNHYSRKILGYLYAIEHGAKIIYESDDDNVLYDSIHITKEESVESELSCTSNVVNIYAFFGQPKVWPRGFPLDLIIKESQYVEKPVEKGFSIGVQQALVDKDPDVDAIYRLTQAVEFDFEKKPACILNAQNFCPFNTQNTLFHYKTFWGLYIPPTTAFRACDIWRSYITQRLMREVNQRLCFSSASAVQERNQHILLNDFAGELDCYLKSGALIRYLHEWTDSSTNLDLKMVNLFKGLIEKEFLKDSETSLLNAWISDLKTIGYQWPSTAI